jgi:hypothetical protein
LKLAVGWAVWVRAGAGVAFDRFGSDLVTEFDRTGSPGLASQVTQPANTDFTTAPRYTGGALPTLPAAPNAKFPFTPNVIVGGFNSQVGIASNLRTPYAYLLNASFARYGRNVTATAAANSFRSSRPASRHFPSAGT